MTTNTFRQGRRDGVADLPGNRSLVRCFKYIPSWERLKCSTFAERYSTIFHGVTESAVRETVEARCDRGCRTVPIHSTVDIPEDVMFPFVRGDLQRRVI